MKRDYPPTIEEYARTTRRIDALFRDESTRTGIQNHSYQTRHLHSIFHSFADYINPLDRITGEPNLDVATCRRAVQLGSTAGLLLTQYAYQPEKITGHEIFAGSLKIIVADESDELQQRHLVGGQLIEMGEQGLRLAGEETSDWLEDLEDETIMDVRCRRLYRLGAGVVIHCAQLCFSERKQITYKADMRAFERELQNVQGVNWDELLED